MATGTGTKDDPWVLKTPPGTSEYTMYRDDGADPPSIVCQVGGTKLLYDARAIDDLHAMLKAHGDWMPLGGVDEQKAAPGDQTKPGPAEKASDDASTVAATKREGRAEVTCPPPAPCGSPRRAP